jgi:peptidoglycan/LPS O-acetylase OafA/YrhL
MPGLDGLRALAAVGIAALHVGFYTQKPWTSAAPGTLFGGLRLGVVMFFVLSAFLLSLPWIAAARGERAAPDVTRYLVRRLARVLPAYYLALALAAVLLAGTGSPRMPSAHDVPLMLVLVQNWSASAHGALVPPSWTLCAELAFYLVLPLIGLVFCRWAATAPRQLAACGCIALASILFNAAIELFSLPGHWHGTFPSVAYAFALGVAAASVATRLRPSRRARAGLLVCGWVAVIADVGAHVALGVPGVWFWRDLPAAIGFAAVIVAVAAGPARVLGSPTLRWLAARSYGIYLFHYPVLLALSARGHLPHALFPAAAVVLGLTLAIADLSWRALELPMIRWARRVTRTRPERARQGVRRERAPWRPTIDAQPRAATSSASASGAS